ncbi:hypothetical protein [Streptomyces sp. NPDC005568]|uniref:hypothetical protein n=1 Tax=Streptomyces sp. NPDC005568 TaxID=3156887 RepID=UPI0033BC390C
MTSDRHLALMALMTEIKDPAKAYYRSVGQASRAYSESAEWERAVARAAQPANASPTASYSRVHHITRAEAAGNCGSARVSPRS